MYSVKCGVQSVEAPVWSVECGVECRMGSGAAGRGPDPSFTAMVF